MNKQKPIKGEWAIERTVRISSNLQVHLTAWPRRDDLRVGSGPTEALTRHREGGARWRMEMDEKREFSVVSRRILFSDEKLFWIEDQHGNRCGNQCKSEEAAIDEFAQKKADLEEFDHPTGPKKFLTSAVKQTARARRWNTGPRCQTKPPEEKAAKIADEVACVHLAPSRGRQTGEEK